MKKLLGLAAAILIAAASTRDASATCAGGFTIYLSGQLPDVTLTSGVPETIHFNPWYVSFNSTSGSCGIFARSTVPGCCSTTSPRERTRRVGVKSSNR